MAIKRCRGAYASGTSNPTLFVARPGRPTENGSARRPLESFA